MYILKSIAYRELVLYSVAYIIIDFTESISLSQQCHTPTKPHIIYLLRTHIYCTA